MRPTQIFTQTINSADVNKPDAISTSALKAIDHQDTRGIVKAQIKNLLAWANKQMDNHASKNYKNN